MRDVYVVSVGLIPFGLAEVHDATAFGELAAMVMNILEGPSA